MFHIALFSGHTVYRLKNGSKRRLHRNGGLTEFEDERLIKTTNRPTRLSRRRRSRDGGNNAALFASFVRLEEEEAVKPPSESRKENSWRDVLSSLLPSRRLQKGTQTFALPPFLFPFSFPSSQREERRESLLSAFSPGRTPSLSSSSFSLFPDATRGDLDKKIRCENARKVSLFSGGGAIQQTLQNPHFFTLVPILDFFGNSPPLSLSEFSQSISGSREDVSPPPGPNKSVHRHPSSSQATNVNHSHNHQSVNEKT